MPGLSLDALSKILDIDMVETVRPGGICPERCIHCGASDELKGAAIIQLTREELRENLTQEVPPSEIIGDVKSRIVASFLSPFVTTGVDTEPTHGEGFIHAAELIHELTEGKSGLLFISHGVRQYVRTPENAGDERGGKLIVDRVFSVFDSRQRQNGLDKDPEKEKKEWAECITLLQERGVSDEAIFNILLAKDEARRVDDLLIDGLGVVDELLSCGVMKAVCSLKDNGAASRFSKVAEMTRDGIVPGMIITVDFARAAGKINFASNAASYIKTLNLLKPALSADSKGFVTVSVQGLQDAIGNPYSAERALVFYDQILKRTDLTDEERLRIRVDEGRDYVKVGSAKRTSVLADSLSGDEHSEIIPDSQFVNDIISPKRKRIRGRLLATGEVEHQNVIPGATYNSTVSGPWKSVRDVQKLRGFALDDSRALVREIGSPVSELTRLELRKKKEHLGEGITWDHALDSQEDFFLIKPFSRIKKEHRELTLDYLKELFGVEDLMRVKVLDEKKGQADVMRYRDVKTSCLSRIYKGQDVGDVIYENSPYKSLIAELDDISETGEEMGLVMGKTAYLEGEIVALTKAFVEKVPELAYLRGYYEDVTDEDSERKWFMGDL